MPAYVVLGLAFGDEGKGATVDHIASSFDSSLAIRFNGGAQCAHNVVADEKHHCFKQFGSNSLNKGAATFFSEYAYFNPLTYFNERKRLLDLGVEPDFYLAEKAMITTPWHMAVNRLKEIARGKNAHGSCGMGIGETVEYDENLIARDFASGTALIQLEDIFRHFNKIAVQLQKEITSKEVSKEQQAEIDKVVQFLFKITPEDYYTRLKTLACKSFHVVDSKTTTELLNQPNLIFEGAQGVLLDQDFGFHPHTTWSKTTDENAFALLNKYNVDVDLKVVGVLRTKHTRHGHGPFPSFNPGTKLAERHNVAEFFSGAFKIGHFDKLLAEYAIAVNNGVDFVAWTHCDWVEPIGKSQKQVISYRTTDGEHITKIEKLKHPNLVKQEKLTDMLKTVECVLSDPYGSYDVTPNLELPVFSTSSGPARKDRKFH